MAKRRDRVTKIQTQMDRGASRYAGRQVRSTIRDRREETREGASVRVRGRRGVRERARQARMFNTRVQARQPSGGVITNS